MASSELEFFARCASGFEPVLATELKGLRLHRVRPLRGGVAFFGPLRDGYRACLWSRVATRVQLVLCRVPADDADAFHAGVASFAWEEHVREGATIAVEAHGTNDQLRNTTFVALKAKDAVCDRLRDLRGARPDVDTSHPDVAINVALHERKATVYLNLSGASLHRRGYREDGVQTEAPLKETLAAGVLLAAGWPDLAREGGTLVDPMCGSGTFAVEGALMAMDIAPGLWRDRWGFDGWAGHDEDAWSELIAEACERSAEGHTDARVLAGDIDPQAVRIARDNVRRAQVGEVVQLWTDDAARLARHLRGVRARGVQGLCVANPPYGQRLLSREDLPQVNEALAAAVEALPVGWRVALLTPDAGVDTALGRVPERVIDCYNGPLAVSLRLYKTDAQKRLVQDVVSLSGVQRRVPMADERSSQFVARLRKVAKERARWARKQDISCYRVYDADLPDYALSVDVYEGAALGTGASTNGAAVQSERYAVVAEYRRPASVDTHAAQRRLADAVALTAAVLDVPTAHVVVRPWEGVQKGRNRAGQREGKRPGKRMDAASVPLCVTEAGHRFEVDLVGKPDTGLPLQMRGVRELVGTLASGKRFANLFGVSSAATVYAAAGGAAQTVTLEPFLDRMERLRRTMQANGFVGKRHHLVREDALTWIEQEARAHRTYDLVLCAPPNWLKLPVSYEELVQAALRVTAPGGTVVFACEGPEVALDATEVTAQVASADFARTRTPLRCWRIPRPR